MGMQLIPHSRIVLLLTLVIYSVQFLYSLAILLSTPLQLFPAIRIIENGLFVKSGKYSNKVKWEKNVFRFCLVIVTAIISWGGSDDLDKFVALTGSFACVPLVYMYPVSIFPTHLCYPCACCDARFSLLATLNAMDTTLFFDEENNVANILIYRHYYT